MKGENDEKPPRLDSAPLEYAPENELGVVFLFAALAKRWGLRIESVRSGFPDCIAYQRTGKGDKRRRIEFEFCSSNFKTHGHDPRKCDWIVCWEHDWHAVPAGIEVIELRKEFGLGFNVWIRPLHPEWKSDLRASGGLGSWSVPNRSSPGDLLLYYFTSPDNCMTDICQMTGNVRRLKAGYKPGLDFMAPIRRVCMLASPVFLADMKRHRVLQTAGFIRANVRGRQRVTEFWPYLYDLIVRRNPSVQKRLAKFDPARC